MILFQIVARLNPGTRGGWAVSFPQGFQSLAKKIKKSGPSGTGIENIELLNVMAS
jgi:hypothetical protein